MKFSEIQAKITKGEALTDAEKEFFKNYDPDKGVNDAAAAARRSAEKERDDLKKKLDESEAALEALKKDIKDNDQKGKTELEKLQANIGTLTKEVNKLTQAKAEAETKAATLARSQTIRDAAKAAGITLAPKSVNESLFHQMLETHLSSVDIADKTALTAALEAFKADNPGIIAAPGGGTGGKVGVPPGGGNSGKNPWAKESFNLTEQMNLQVSDPAKAQSLAAEAGVTL